MRQNSDYYPPPGVDREESCKDAEDFLVVLESGVDKQSHFGKQKRRYGIADEFHRYGGGAECQSGKLRHRLEVDCLVAEHPCRSPVECSNHVEENEPATGEGVLQTQQPECDKDGGIQHHHGAYQAFFFVRFGKRDRGNTVCQPDDTEETERNESC